MKNKITEAKITWLRNTKVKTKMVDTVYEATQISIWEKKLLLLLSRKILCSSDHIFMSHDISGNVIFQFEIFKVSPHIKDKIKILVNIEFICLYKISDFSLVKELVLKQFSTDTNLFLFAHNFAMCIYWWTIFNYYLWTWNCFLDFFL